MKNVKSLVVTLPNIGHGFGAFRHLFCFCIRQLQCTGPFWLGTEEDVKSSRILIFKYQLQASLDLFSSALCPQGA